ADLGPRQGPSVRLQRLRVEWVVAGVKQTEQANLQGSEMNRRTTHAWLFFVAGLVLILAAALLSWKTWSGDLPRRKRKPAMAELPTSPASDPVALTGNTVLAPALTPTSALRPERAQSAPARNPDRPGQALAVPKLSQEAALIGLALGLALLAGIVVGNM
ncbi:MAG TPA: hypothetical protein VF707_04475, partial [Ardenticatenaceae bacterium]